MNSQLKHLISSLKGTPEEIANQLNAKTVEVSRPAVFTSAGLVVELGVEMATEAIARFEAAMNSDNPLAPLLRAHYVRLNSTGIDFGNELTKQLILQLAAMGVFTPEIRDALLNIDKVRKSQYELIAGDGAVITPAEVRQYLVPDDAPTVVSRVVINAVYEPGSDTIRGSVLKEHSVGDVVKSREVLSHLDLPDLFETLKTKLKG
jgi:hypothetical protein